jgi:hypothetical protein
VKIAYIVTAYALPDQVVRLVRRLNAPDTSFFVHVDRRTDDETYERIAGPLSAYPNVHFSRRYRWRWGHFVSVRVKLTAMQEILTHDSRFDYVIPISGQSYPMKSNRHIQRFLQESEGRSFMQYFSKEAPWAAHWDERHVYWYFSCGRWCFAFPKADMFETPAVNRLWNVLAKGIPLRRKFPEGFKPFYGSAFWCLSRECAEYVLEFARQNKAFVRFFTYTSCPSEMFFQTILLNSALKDRVVNDDLVYIDFSQHLAHPAILGKNDFNRFMSTSNLFARKFDAAVDGEVLDMIDAAIS